MGLEIIGLAGLSGDYALFTKVGTMALSSKAGRALILHVAITPLSREAPQKILIYAPRYLPPSPSPEGWSGYHQDLYE